MNDRLNTELRLLVNFVIASKRRQVIDLSLIQSAATFNLNRRFVPARFVAGLYANTARSIERVSHFNRRALGQVLRQISDPAIADQRTCAGIGRVSLKTLIVTRC